MYQSYDKSNGYIKRASNGLTSAFSTPNLCTAAPLTSRSMSVDENFQDASEHIIYSRSLNLLDTIAEAHISLNLFLNNNFALAEERMQVLSDRSMYHALGHSSLLFLKAMMTCDRGDLERAIEAGKSASTVIGKFRARYSFYDSVYRLSGQYRVLTDHEIHAEMCYAEALLFRAILTFFCDETLTSFIRGAIRIRTCFQSFKECQRILNNYSWAERDPGIKAQFESGVRNATGVFNLMLSILPIKVLRLLAIVGFSGNKTYGMQELLAAATIPNTLRTTSARFMLLCWHLFIVYYIGAEQPDLELCKRLMMPITLDFPNGAIVLFMRARLHLVHGNLDNAIFFYNKSIESQTFYKQFHHICYWELLFAHCYMRKWSRAANYAKRLMDESKWSKCVYIYFLAGLINADMTAPNRSETVKLLLERVPLCRLRIAGKSVPVEKFCERKARRFLKTKRLYYPHYEFLYFWNSFFILERYPELFIAPILDDIELYWSKFPSDNDINEICIYEFLRGVCFKALKDFERADECFTRVITSESVLTDYFYLVPNAVFESAQIRIQNNQLEEAQALLAKARSYQKYSFENKLQFRIRGAMDKLTTSAD